VVRLRRRPHTVRPVLLGHLEPEGASSSSGEGPCSPLSGFSGTPSTSPSWWSSKESSSTSCLSASSASTRTSRRKAKTLCLPRACDLEADIGPPCEAPVLLRRQKVASTAGAEAELPSWADPRRILADLEAEEKAEYEEWRDLQAKRTSNINEELSAVLHSWEGIGTPQEVQRIGQQPAALRGSCSEVVWPGFSRDILEGLLARQAAKERRAREAAEEEEDPRLLTSKPAGMSAVIERVRTKIAAAKSFSRVLPSSA